MSTTPTQSSRLRSKLVTKRGRFNARLTDEQKQLFERAAALYGQSVSQFVLSVAQHAAEQVIHDHEVITLSASDSRAIREALRHPAPVGPVLHQAAERYKTLMGDQ